MEDTQSTRRRWLGLTAALGAGVTACKRSGPEQAEETGPRLLGKPVSAYGERSPYETDTRALPNTRTPEAASSRTPLQDSCGILTPSSLHYERHHAGVPNIDPARHRLLLHGLVDRPLIFTVDEIRRMPSVSHIHFLECSGNSGGEWGPKTGRDASQSCGLASCSEWTGVPLSSLLHEAGVQKDAKWLICEGADACKMQRSLPLDKAMQDTLVAWGQNGEALRPEQGYPLRLVVPGWEGNISVKWLRRIKVTGQPYMVRDETSHYTDLMPDGTARIFTFVMDAKSLITFPSGGQRLNGPGSYEVTGLAWSGRGRIERVEVSTDLGRSWQNANLQEPRLPMAFTRFRFPWKWDGSAAVLQSRCTDESGYVQPSKEELIAVRGLNSQFHYNGIKPWKVMPDGSVTNADA
ncbi:MAG TPA: sulfite dehydrogenase [Bryobacteraceae bacterium]|nr:sulfite dehydrogenase [Bryobacteraceae bacterium]